jgi:DNA-binding beta-propeller fold protein YncE
VTARSTPFVTLLAWGILTAPVWAQPAARAFVLDAGAHALVALDLAAGQRTGVLPLPGSPARLNRSDDGRYLVVLDRGPGEDKDERGYKATGRSSATIVDEASLKVVGRVELGFGLDSVVTPPGGRLVVTCPGYQAKNPAESLVRELVVVDLATARETGRLTLEPGTSLTGYSRDGTTLALLQGLPRSAKYPFPKSKVTFLDAGALSVTGTLDAGGWSFVQRDADRVYLIDQGQPDKNPEKNRNGAIDVVLLAQRRVEHVDLGRSPTGGVLIGDGLMAFAGEGPAGGATGELRLIREGTLAATLDVGEKPRLVEAVDGTVYVVGSKAVTLVDTKALRVSGTIPLDAVVGGGDHPFELAVTPDRRRAFIHYPAEDKVAVLDLEQRRAIGSAKTGRGGKKLFNSVMSTLTYGATERTFFYNAGDPPQMQVRTDGRFAYVLNLDTSDVTVVDADTAQAVEKIGAGGSEVELLGDKTVLVVGSEIHVIDAARNLKTDQIRLPGLRGLVRTPDGAIAVALAEHTVLILDGATGKERARLTDFVNLTRIVFAPTAAAAPAP